MGDLWNSSDGYLFDRDISFNIPQSVRGRITLPVDLIPYKNCVEDHLRELPTTLRDLNKQTGRNNLSFPQVNREGLENMFGISINNTPVEIHEVERLSFNGISGSIEFSSDAKGVRYLSLNQKNIPRTTDVEMSNLTPRIKRVNGIRGNENITFNPLNIWRIVDLTNYNNEEPHQKLLIIKHCGDVEMLSRRGFISDIAEITYEGRYPLGRILPLAPNFTIEFSPIQIAA